MYCLKKSAAESICEAAKNVYPNEFISMLGGDKKTKTINELVLLPATFGRNFSSIATYLAPIDSSIIGSVHSHPGRFNYPSRGDLGSFSKMGEIHLIISYPFNISNIRAYYVSGKEEQLKIIED
jgi:proteasome lid subunit RPN8/RPN11